MNMLKKMDERTLEQTRVHLIGGGGGASRKEKKRVSKVRCSSFYIQREASIQNVEEG